MNTIEQIREFTNAKLRELFDQLEEGQQNKFNRIFGEIGKIDKDKIEHAIYLCEKTIQENLEKKL